MFSAAGEEEAGGAGEDGASGATGTGISGAGIPWGLQLPSNNQHIILQITIKHLFN